MMKMQQQQWLQIREVTDLSEWFEGNINVIKQNIQDMYICPVLFGKAKHKISDTDGTKHVTEGIINRNLQ